MAIIEVVSGGDRRSLMKRFERKSKQQAISELVDFHLLNCARIEKLEAERDAALARVAELERQEPVAHLRESDLERLNKPGIAGSAGSLWNGPREGFVPVYTAPVAQVQHSVPRAWLDVQAERRRQVEVEGYHGFRDNHYINYELSKAARAYIEVSWHALSGGLPCKKPESWPWMAGFKWADGRTMLVKAGALILAEIERLDRAAAPGKEEV
ncbi:MAG: hypothetical protein E6256_22275 [Pseudomonas aeruginosa]|nr:hypothetical protein [Pseudomonas aeruginosa]